MLRLLFRPRQEVFISDNIRVVVLRIDKVRNTVELGFDAPKEIKIFRKFMGPRQNQNNGQESKNAEETK